ncbi:hypothetical protein [Streptosporangium canum]|uniref:hypothetical protein n=1 Tax=Streptosporangium canum TaxID=324952 RepID=UPI00339EA4F0
MTSLADSLPTPPASEIDVAELRRRVVELLAAEKTSAPARLRIIRTAADLEVGDWLLLHGGDLEVKVTHLNPPTREETLAAGRREVWSLGSCWPMDADDPVTAQPREIAQGVPA